MIEVLSDPDAIEPYLDSVRKAADAHTSALGFFPSSLYGEFARRGELYIASIGSKYAGHLLFDAGFPRARILQMYCCVEFRRLGVARTLLVAAIQRFTRQNYLSVQARVASDLSDANSFWDANDFHVQRIERGRGRPARQILVRIRELDSPQLFATSSLVSPGNPLGLRPTTTSDSPLFLVDLNVLFDLARKRVRHEQVKLLFRAFNAGHCRLGVSEEVRTELVRTLRAGSADPMLELIDTLSQFATPPIAQCKALCDQLAPLVFPNQSRDGTLSVNDLSDLAHLATAIHHGVSGFVTSESAHLRAASSIQDQFGLRVLSPTALGVSQFVSTPVRTIETKSEDLLTLRSLSAADDETIRSLLKPLGIDAAALAGHWLPALAGAAAPHRLGAYVGGQLAGYLTWTRTPGEARVRVRAALNEREPRSADLGRLLLRSLVESITTIGPCHVQMELPPHQTELRDQARSYGFHASGSPNGLSKISVGRIVTPTTWAEAIHAIERVSGLKLPKVAPRYADGLLLAVDCPDGERRHVPLDLLETYLSPALFVLAERPAVVTPIERRFAEPLLGTSRTTSLLPECSVQLHAERHFVHDPKASRRLSRGTLMLFYESGTGKGVQAITAVARVAQVHLKRRDALDVKVLERSVLTLDSLSKLGRSPTKTVTAFDNIFHLPIPVSLKHLRVLGCGTGNDLITTRTITDQQLQAILSEGFRHV